MNANIQIVKSLLISDFPSGSSLNFHEGRLYLIGDDSTHILVLDANYNKIDSIHLFDFAEKRIPKSDKIDLEGSAVMLIDGTNHLLIIGSASRKNRKRIIIIPFSEKGLDFNTLKNSIHKTKVFINRIKLNGLEEINLEGVCTLKNDLLLGNRGNRSNPSNHLIITERNFWQHQEEAKVLISKLLFPAEYNDEVLGLSELCYVEEMDMLLITLTSEASDNSYDDGVIGDSYISWIKTASRKMQHDELRIDGMINLSNVNTIFKNEKIEGITVESVTGSEILLHLISDNDTGESRLFKILLSITS